MELQLGVIHPFADPQSRFCPSTIATLFGPLSHACRLPAHLLPACAPLCRYSKLGFAVSLEEFDEAYGPNIVAVKISEANPTKFVVFGAHFDCRATERSSGTQKAPGANDDGSGVAIQLEFAKAISVLGQDFEYSVMIASFGGEEQGLFGSAAL